MNILFITQQAEDIRLAEKLRSADLRWNPGAADLRVILCDDLAHALAYLQQQNFQAILLDAPSPVQTRQILQTLNQHIRHLPVLLIASNRDEQPVTPEEWHAYGVEDVLPRAGLSVELLSRILPGLLEQQRLRAALEQKSGELQESQHHVHQREVILKAISRQAERFLKTTDWRTCVGDFLASLGEVTDADRVYIFQNEYKPDGNILAGQKYEWVRPGISPQIDNPALQRIELKQDYNRWISILGKNRVIHGKIRNFPENERGILEAQDIVSILVVPVFCGETWWGFIGFDACSETRWKSLDVPTLRLAAGILGSSIQRLQSETVIHDNAITLRSLLNAVTESISLIDTSGKLLVINEAGARRIGKPHESLIGLTLYEVFSPEIAQKRMNMMQKVIETGQPHKDLDKRDGILFQHTLYPVFNENGSLNQIAVFSQDITEREKAEEALNQLNQELERRVEERTNKLTQEMELRQQIEDILMESERKFRCIVQDQEEKVCRFLPDGTLTFVNTAYCLFYQKTEDQLLDRLFWDLIPPDTRSSVRQHLDALTPENPTGTYEHHIITPDGQKRWIRWTNRAYFDESLTPLEYQSTGQDLTDRKQAEEELLCYANRLENIERVGSRLRMVEDRQETLAILTTHCASAVSAETSGICLMQGEEIERVVCFDNDRLSNSQNRFSKCEHILEKFKNGKPLVFHRSEMDLQNKFCQALFKNGAEVVYLFPLQGTRLPFGLLYLTFNQSRELSSDEQYLLTTMIELGVITLNRISTAEQLRKHMTIRERELDVLYRVSALSNEILDFKTVLEKSLKLVLEATSSQAGAIHLLDEEKDTQTMLLAVQQGLPEVLFNRFRQIPLAELAIGKERPETSQTLQDTWLAYGYNCLPVLIRIKGYPHGLVSLFKEESRPFSQEEKAFLSAVSDQLGIVVENSRLRSLFEETAVFEERQRLARELHDSVVQSLYGLLLFNRTALEAIKIGDLQNLQSLLEKSGKMGSQALQEMRLMLCELRPLQLEQEGLISVLEMRLNTVERRSPQADAHLLVEGQPRRLPGKVELEVYRIAIEALNNALKHAGSSDILVRLIFHPDQLQLWIIDKGKGFDPQKARTGGMGMRNMDERAKQIHADLQVLSYPGMGTQVMLTVPLDKDIV